MPGNSIVEGRKKRSKGPQIGLEPLDSRGEDTAMAHWAHALLTVQLGHCAICLFFIQKCMSDTKGRKPIQLKSQSRWVSP